uniref:MORN repeat-containing protein 5 n=1 Tax=Chromera velia CCMP2878 TaxID=1169474 RepID=A0A0G4I014_9ALVE|mmetsp:Transcript_33404/g.66245  ORF Transcript_33404/g.66245 Transcript_33404/m.66245 type:complete len:240 (+) Transcript_33404:180-899(+)|eukprot:Cvel_1606.t1-p1 / transcript=Cvel_1606.t1 / gene=Cvel_1606 / organism=Chromera_velia_CCMP2878 / gene_product=Radial spoke head 1 homolog, putative / transcript_product=Radial spoke head 1 homolog, putative / location=Cvel_scaffold57:110606-113009(+) / protein_length=239 / sequence_SO=supercontig / SO=protein_coding / is_pseudo=false
MAEEGAAYQLVTAEGETLTASRGFTGKGKATYPNGDTYEGTFARGMKHENGTYTYANGDKYEGGYWMNKRAGMGRLSFAKGGFYHGNFEEGKRHGEGTEKYANNDVYTGSWVSGKKHGRGIYAFAVTRFKYVGEWEQGQMKKGRWVWKNGAQYVGTFKDNQPDSIGDWLFPNGTLLRGKYTPRVVPLDRLEQLHQPGPPKPSEDAEEGEAPPPTDWKPKTKKVSLSWKTEAVSALNLPP